jgi:hypothetical protein
MAGRLVSYLGARSFNASLFSSLADPLARVGLGHRRRRPRERRRGRGHAGERSGKSAPALAWPLGSGSQKKGAWRRLYFVFNVFFRVDRRRRRGRRAA